MIYAAYKMINKSLERHQKSRNWRTKGGGPRYDTPLINLKIEQNLK